jgi:hypothetical protein
MQAHPSRLDLREVEDVVDDREEGLAAVGDRRGVVALLGVEAGLEQEPAHPDDGVHRGTDLVAGRGEERALGGVRLLGHLARLVGLAEQAGVLDRDGCLLRQADQEAQVGIGERLAALAAPHRHHPDDAAPGEERRGHDPLVGDHLGTGDRHRPGVVLGVVHELGDAPLREVPDDPFPGRDGVAHDQLGQLACGNDRDQVGAIRLLEEHRARVRLQKRTRPFGDPLQHRVEVEHRADLPAELREGSHLGRAPAGLPVQARVRDGHTDVCGDRGEQARVALHEPPRLFGALHADHADGVGLGEDRDAQIRQRGSPHHMHALERLGPIQEHRFP